MPFLPGFRHLSMILQIFEGNVPHTVDHYRATGQITTDAEATHCAARARCVKNWLEKFAPEEFLFLIRKTPKTRSLTPDEATCLHRIVGVLQANAELDEDGLVPTMKSLTTGTALDNKTFLPVVYDLLIDRDKGPKLTTLITAMGIPRALELLAPSLEVTG